MLTVGTCLFIVVLPQRLALSTVTEDDAGTRRADRRSDKPLDLAFDNKRSGSMSLDECRLKRNVARNEFTINLKKNKNHICFLQFYIINEMLRANK